MEAEIRPNSRVGVGMLIPHLRREGTAVKVDLYGGQMYEADESGTVSKLEDFSGTLTFNFGSPDTAVAAESILEIMRDEDKPVLVRFEREGHYGSITDPVTGMRIATGAPA